MPILAVIQRLAAVVRPQIDVPYQSTAPPSIKPIPDTVDAAIGECLMLIAGYNRLLPSGNKFKTAYVNYPLEQCSIKFKLVVLV